LKKLAQNTALVGGSEFMMMFVALIRNKYLAVNIGAQGFGVYNLLESFFHYANLIAGSWLSTASLKYISEYNSEGKKEEVKVLFNLTTYLVFFSATVVSILFLVFFPVFKSAFLSEDILFSYYAFFAASFWGTSLVNLFRVVLQGLMDITKIVKIRIITQIANLVLVVILVYLFDLVGLFINLAVIALFTATLFFLVVKKKIKLEKFNINWYRTGVAKKIFSFSAIDVFLGFIDQTGQYLKRILIVDFLSMSSLGLFAAARGIMKYLSMFTNSSMVYFKPKMSQALSTVDRNKGMNDYFRLMLLLGGVGSAMTVFFSYEIIRVLYSKDFVNLTSVLFVFVMVQYFSNISNGYMFSVVGMAKLGIHSASIILSAPLAILIPYFYMKYEPAFMATFFGMISPSHFESAEQIKDALGLFSIALGTISLVAIRVAIYGVYLRKSQKIQMNLSNLFLLILGVTVISMANYSLIYPVYYRIGFAALAILLYGLLLKKEERNWITKIIKEKILRKK
jgi:O-antigen/teichoic acid export membrane protein